MQRAIDDLAGILERQIRNYHMLKGLLLKKRKAIIAHDLKQLADITLQIETLIGANNQLEIGRIDLAKRIAKELGLRHSRPTLAEIAERVEEPTSKRLLELRRRSIGAIHDVQRQNRINAELLKYSADLIDSVLRRLVEPASDTSTYGSTGQARSKTALVSLLDQHV
jgi:flagellar biosynthesis/type III secretory pathway chaperone